MSGSVSKMKLFHTSEDKRNVLDKMEKVRISELKTKASKSFPGDRCKEPFLQELS